MPWQQYVADVIGEIDPATGLLAYSQFGLTVPRQSGKSTLILAKAVHRASATRFFGPRQRIVYTAQTRKAAREKWEEDYCADLEAAPAFRKRVVAHKGNGNEHLRFTNKSRFGIEANTEKAGHGPTIDEAYIDEAFAQVDARLEQAFRPAMITRPNKQLGWISTAGWSDASAYLQAKTRLGRAAVEAGRRNGLAYFEWSAPEDADPGDRDVWRACMPALGYTITEDAIADEFDTMDLADFKRAYLNQWVPKPVEVVEDVVDPDLWAACLDIDSQIVGTLHFAVDVSPSQSWASIAVAGLTADGVPHVEITSTRTMGGHLVVDHRPGTGWVVGRLVELGERWPGLKPAIASGSAAESLETELTKAGLEFEHVKGNDVAAACGLFYRLATTKGLRHLGQPEFTSALAGARKNVDDGEGGWRWGRRKSISNVTPLYGATLAVWVLEKSLSADYDIADSFG